MTPSQEWMKASQTELLAHPHSPECLFGDISSFLKPQIQDKLEHWQKQIKSTMRCFHSCSNDARSRGREVKRACCSRPWLSQLQFCRSGFCLKHGRPCRFNETIGMIHVAGTPCTAVSTMGLRDFDSAMSRAHFHTWVALRLECQEPVIIQENVEEFDRTLLVSELPMYDWSFDVVSPAQLGWPVVLARQWCVLLDFHHVAAVLLLICSAADVAARNFLRAGVDAKRKRLVSEVSCTSSTRCFTATWKMGGRSSSGSVMLS